MDRLLQNALADICKLLDTRQFRFAIVGGIAASIRGRLRATEDIDLILISDVDRALEFAHSLESTAFRPLFPEFEKVLRTAYILALEHQPTGVSLDLAIGASGFEQQVVERAQWLRVAATKVCVATAEDLILMKALAGRPQDRQDIAGLVAVGRDSIDWSYCELVAKQLEPLVEMELVNAIKQLREQQL